MKHEEIAEVLAKPISQELLGSSIPAEHFDGWEQGVRALYDEMAQITIEPAWAKLLDFETTIPKAVEDLVQARQGAAVVDGQLAAGDPDVRQGN